MTGTDVEPGYRRFGALPGRQVRQPSRSWLREKPPTQVMWCLPNNPARVFVAAPSKDRTSKGAGCLPM
ncbi:hypothetical protein ACFYXF_30395 [Streptomyces sp. NPDC002680]|uniref:hypothetical protein n=1 Tax=Streptomyces sp. NPDC002680 TaxID=3364659 RepID=UPI00369CF566